jgi:hypothetical protein
MNLANKFVLCDFLYEHFTLFKPVNHCKNLYIILTKNHSTNIYAVVQFLHHSTNPYTIVQTWTPLYKPVYHCTKNGAQRV